MPTNFATIQREYLELLNLLALILESQKGYRPEDPRWVDFQELATKLFVHASSIYYLSDGTRVLLPSQNERTYFFDFASIVVLARAVLDAYLNIFEVFIEPPTPDIFTYRHALWNLAGTVLRERELADPADTFLARERAKALAYGQELRTTIESTAHFQTLTERQKNQARRGERMRGPLIERARPAGFGPKRLEMLWDYYSGFMHSDGASVAQVITAQTKEEQLDHVRVHMTMVAMVLGKIIVFYSGHFATAQVVCESNPVAFVRADWYKRLGEMLD